jgi:flagellar basal-body rod modification protein FlgD
MPMSGVNPDLLFKPGQVVNSSTVRTPRKPEELGMEDFLQLMMAQMTNQDIFNPVSDTDFIAQMAQFSTLQGINAMLQHQVSAYAVSYVGKNVVIADLDERGILQRFEGFVERVTFSEGQPMVFVNGKGYELHKVMEIRSADFKTEDPDDSDDQEGIDK